MPSFHQREANSPINATIFVYTLSTNLWSKLSCQLDIRWLGKLQKTVCQQLPEVRQVGGHGVGLVKREKTIYLLLSCGQCFFYQDKSKHFARKKIKRQ